MATEIDNKNRSFFQEEAYNQALVEASSPLPEIEKVKDLLQGAHTAGDSRATYALATWYLHGKHVRKNLREALRLLRDAAKSCVPDALYDLAVCYEEGEGVATNPKMAAELYLRAALSGEEQSVYEIGRCYYYGIGVEKDRRIARVWLDRAREIGVDDDSPPKIPASSSLDVSN